MRLFAIGLVAGFFSALFGVGGGIVVVPLLILLVGFAERPAMATSLASIGLIAAVGTISYAIRGDVHVGYGLLLGTAGRGSERSPAPRCSSASQARCSATASRPCSPRSESGCSSDGDRRRHRASACSQERSAGLFGVGGGLIFVPTLVLLFDLGQVDAEATSLLAILPVVIAGTWRQHRYGNVRWRTALVIGVVAVAGVELGVLARTRCPRRRCAASSRSSC